MVFECHVVVSMIIDSLHMIVTREVIRVLGLGNQVHVLVLSVSNSGIVVCTRDCLAVTTAVLIEPPTVGTIDRIVLNPYRRFTLVLTHESGKA